MSNYSCQFCYRRTTLGYIKNYFPSETNMHQIIRHTLYHKYATSQNYYFTKDINEILAKTTSNRTILYQDYLCYDEEDEYLKRFYEMHEYSHKSQLLTEFYKFHRDLPRWVVKKQILKTLNYYYDKRRKIEFYKIQRQIEIENQMNPTDPPKGIIGERPHLSDSTPQSENSEPQSKVNVDNILEGISFSNKKQQTSQDLSKIVQIPECSLGDIQQIINLFSQKPDSPIQKQQYQWFNKRKNQSKKSLKLDELALSLSARTHQNPQEAKMPLSARYQQSCSNRLIDQSNKQQKLLLVQAKLQNKHQSSTFSKEKIMELKQNKELFIKKFKLEEKNKKSASPKKDQNKSMQNKINKEIKQLELKIIKSLQEMKNIKNSSHSNQEQKQNSISLIQNNQISSLDQKALHQMLKSPDSFHQQLNQKQQSNNTNSRALQKQSQELSQKNQKQNTIQWKQKQVQVLDMKKIITNKKDVAPQTERVKKTIPALNLNLIGTINQSASMTTRNNSFAPNLAYASVLTPKQNNINFNENNLNNLLRDNHQQK